MTQQAPPPQFNSGDVPPAGSANPQQAHTPTPKAGGGGKSILLRIIGAVAVVAVLFVGGVIYRNMTGDPSTANVGDCVYSPANVNDTKVVDCTDAKANAKVVGKVENKSEADFNANFEAMCKPFPTAETAYWQGRKSSGDVLCLEPYKK